jgi:hypothetical protein
VGLHATIDRYTWTYKSIAQGGCFAILRERIPRRFLSFGQAERNLVQTARVLHSGDTVGPGPSIKAGNRPMTHWLAGADD